MSPDDRRERPRDWLESTLDRMEKAELRHASEQRIATADLLRKLEDHVKDDHDVQADMQSALQTLQDASLFEKDTRASRQAWLIALSSLAGGGMIKALEALFTRHP